MGYEQNSPNGQETSANSKPSVLASNQSAIPVKIDQTINGTTNRVNISTDGQVSTNGTVFFFSPTTGGNGTVTQLASGATFTGTIESIVTQQSYSLLFFSDQNATITIKQYIDLAGGKLISNLSYTYIAGSSNFARSGAANGNYIQVVIQNTGGSTTTTLQADIAYGTIPSATPLNNEPCAINEVNGTALNLGPQTPAASLPLTLPNDSVVGATASIAALNIDLLTGTASGWYDAQNFHSVSIQVIGSAGISAGAIFFEETNDTTNASAGNIWQVEETTTLTPTPNISAITIAASTVRMFKSTVVCRYVRVRVSTAFVGGNIKVTAAFSQLAYNRIIQTAHQATAANLNGTMSQGGTWTLQVGNTANTTPILANRFIPVGSTTGDTGAKTVTGNGATQTNVNANGALIVFNIGAVSGTAPTAVLKLQGSSDAGTTWVDIPTASTATLIATGVYGLEIYPAVTPLAGTTTTGTCAQVSGVLPRTWRVVWIIGGTTPSFTITNIQVVYHL